MSAGERTGELLWRMPLHEDYREMIKGRYAQLTNRSERREAMPLTAAEFLHHFAGDTPWAHLDIAGTAWDAKRPYLVGKGASGYGVRLLVSRAHTLIRASHCRSRPSRPSIRTRRNTTIPSAALPLARTGLGRPPTRGATIRLIRSGSDPSTRRSGR